ncbi:MAG TPA: hypothetical protein DCQ58_01090 [Saprospirales bacterium]|nr:hypothetical protein [Saprospirales bacterium]
MKNINLALTIIMIAFGGHLFSQNTTGSAQNESGSCIDETDLTILNIDETILIFDPPVQEIDGENSSPVELDPKAFKNVFFVHGLGGHAASWAPATRHVSTTYKAVTPYISYLQDITIPQAATGLNFDFGVANNALEDEYPNSKGEESIFIGHSMGGVVGRQMDYDVLNYDFKKRFSAMATFGSPHQGAKIIETLQNGEVEEYLNRGCNALSNAAIKKIESDFELQLNGILGLLFNERIKNLEKSMFGFLDEFAKKYVCDNLLSMGFQSMASNIAPPIGAALNPNSELISTLSTHDIELDNVAFFGLEKGTYEGVLGEGIDGYAALRQLHSLNKMSTATDFGGENEDESYIAEYINLKNYLLSEYTYYSETEDYQYAIPIWENPSDPEGSENQECISEGGVPVFNFLFAPFSWIMTCDLPTDAETALSFRKAYQFVSDFDKEYRILFGHLEIEYQQVGQNPICRCFLTYNGENVVIGDVPCNESDIYHNIMSNSDITCVDEFEPVYDYVEYLHPGDCVVIETSASNFPGVRKTRKLSDNNHQQMRNSRETKEYFRELFEGKEYGSGFKLNIK